MPYNLWILPLMAGYFLITNYIYFKYKYQRLSSQRLLFHSIIAGIILFILFYNLRITIDVICPAIIPFLYQKFYTLPIKNQELLLTSLAIFTLTLPLVWSVNKVFLFFDYFNWRKPVEKAVDDFGDEIEQLFKQSVIERVLIRITLKNHKVYVGYVDEIPPPNKGGYFRLIPFLSGYRDAKSKKIEFNTDYLRALEYYADDPSKYLSFRMDVIIKREEILTAGFFDQELYKILNEE